MADANWPQKCGKAMNMLTTLPCYEHGTKFRHISLESAITQVGIVLFNDNLISIQIWITLPTHYSTQKNLNRLIFKIIIFICNIYHY